MVFSFAIFIYFCVFSSSSLSVEIDVYALVFIVSLTHRMCYKPQYTLTTTHSNYSAPVTFRVFDTVRASVVTSVCIVPFVYSTHKYI